MLTPGFLEKAGSGLGWGRMGERQVLVHIETTIEIAVHWKTMSKI